MSTNSFSIQRQKYPIRMTLENRQLLPTTKLYMHQTFKCLKPLTLCRKYEAQTEK